MSSSAVHYSDWAGQPDVRILCSGEWTTPAWGKGNDKAVAVFHGDNGKRYTFDAAKVTCVACRRKAQRG